jgi:hypothetical protein
MHRRDAIARLADHALRALTPDERAEIVQATWDDSGDPPDDASPARFDPQIVAHLRGEYAGVRNAYLAQRLAALGVVTTVDGELEYRAPCPCCGYRTVAEPGTGELCAVCGWEDDGAAEPDDYSSANYLTLGEARATFARIGAIDERSLDLVLADGPDRYPRVD